MVFAILSILIIVGVPAVGIALSQGPRVSPQLFEAVIESLQTDDWKQREHYLDRKRDGLEIWTANGIAFYNLRGSGLSFTIWQKIRLHKHICAAASASALKSLQQKDGQ